MSRNFSEDKQVILSYMKNLITFAYHELKPNKTKMRAHLTLVTMPSINANKCEETKSSKFLYTIYENVSWYIH